MSKNTKGYILWQLGALAAFLIFIGGGVFMYNSSDNEQWGLFAVGCRMLAVGFYLIGVFGQMIMRSQRHGSPEPVVIKELLKAGLMITVLASCVVFFGISVMLWVSRGMWQIGLAGVVVIIVMTIVAINISIDYQTNGAARRVKKDPNATEHSGVVIAVKPRFPIILFFKTVYMFYEYIIEVDGKKSSAYLKRSNKIAKGLDEGGLVTVLFDSERPRYCAITEIRTDD